jgi:hypothetical protein
MGAMLRSGEAYDATTATNRDRRYAAAGAERTPSGPKRFSPLLHLNPLRLPLHPWGSLETAVLRRMLQQLLLQRVSVSGEPEPARLGQ